MDMLRQESGETDLMGCEVRLDYEETRYWTLLNSVYLTGDAYSDFHQAWTVPNHLCCFQKVWILCVSVELER